MPTIAENAEEIKRRISESQPEMGVQLKLVDTLIRDGLTLERLMAWLSGSFGALAALLAVGAAVALLVFRRGVVEVIAVSAVLGLAATLLGWRG